MIDIKIKIIAVVIFCLFFLNIKIYAKSDDTYSALRMMIDIMEIIDKKYVEETQPKELVLGAIKGLVRTLDPYSQFMDEKDYKEMKTETQGSYGGVGLRITMQDDELTVVTPLPDTPAYFSGILPEDKIIKIDDKSTKDISSDEAVKLMRGNPGTEVVLTIYRPSTKEELSFTITRKKIKIETVKKMMLENNIGYIRLSEFNAQSASDVSKMLKDLSKEEMQAFIFDLRNNPGGLLDSAVNICELFIEQGSIVVSTKGRDNTSDQQYFTQKKPDYPDIPVIILINRGSASASEIVTGTMQDYKRALVIGTNSFGKGSVQQVIPLSDGNALRMTIAKYYLPSGRTIIHSDKKNDKKNGIIPDVYVDVTPETEVKLYMQAESDKLPKNKKQDKINDDVLDTAIKIIKAGKVKEYIDKPSKYLQDYPESEKNKDEKDKNLTEEKAKQQESVTESEPAPAKQESVQTIKDVIKESMKEEKKEIKINFEKYSKQSLFECGSDEISKDSFSDLDLIVEFLKENPNVTVKVEGHTDNIGSEVYNQTLSERRAKLVANYIINKGVDSDRVSTEGFGFSRPIADNDTDEGRAKNRRIEFVFTIDKDKNLTKEKTDETDK